MASSVLLSILSQVIMMSLTTHGIRNARQSALLTSYGCPAETNITIIALGGKHLENVIGKMIEQIQDPCNTIYSFLLGPRRFEKINDDNRSKRLLEVDDNDNTRMTKSQEIEIFQQLREERSIANNKSTISQDDVRKQQRTARQILLILVADFGYQYKLNAPEEVKRIHEETEWTVIMVCSFTCPVNSLPADRLVPITSEHDYSFVKRIVKNSHSNRFEFLKYMKLAPDNENRVTCLTNKTVNIVNFMHSLTVYEKTILLSVNAKNSDFVLYPDPSRGIPFWGDIFEKSEIEKQFGIKEVSGYDFGVLPSEKPDEVFLIRGSSLNGILEKEFCASSSRKSIIFYEGSFDFKTWIGGLDEKCRKTIVRLEFKTANVDLIDGLIDDVKRASCF